MFFLNEKKHMFSVNQPRDELVGNVFHFKRSSEQLAEPQWMRWSTWKLAVDPRKEISPQRPNLHY